MQIQYQLSALKISIILCASLLLSSCVSTQLTSVWSDPSAVKNLNNVLVISASEKDHNRRVNEDALVSELRKKGINANPGYQTLPLAKKLNIEPLLTEVNEIYSGLDAILVTGLPIVEQISQYHPATFRLVPYKYYSRYHGYYRTTYRHVYVPAHTTHHKIVEVGTSLYDPNTGQLLWSAESHTTDPKSIEKLMIKLGKIIGKELIAAGFIQS